MTSLELILALMEVEDSNIFGLNGEDWSYLVKEGWGDQNQLIDPMLELAKEGVIKRSTEGRVEGGQSISRVVWTL